ncbi:transposase [Rarobacter faecitabidus]|uniref:transposase n=1 Tax=Rarobacter faecitabidus TaxID=13243 RepID=UPI00114FC007
MGAFTGIKNHGVEDVCIVVREGLKLLRSLIATTRELVAAQNCTIHLIRHTFRCASKK